MPLRPQSCLTCSSTNQHDRGIIMQTSALKLLRAAQNSLCHFFERAASALADQSHQPFGVEEISSPPRFRDAVGSSAARCRPTQAESRGVDIPRRSRYRGGSPTSSSAFDLTIDTGKEWRNHACDSEGSFACFHADRRQRDTNRRVASLGIEALVKKMVALTKVAIDIAQDARRVFMLADIGPHNVLEFGREDGGSQSMPHDIPKEPERPDRRRRRTYPRSHRPTRASSDAHRVGCLDHQPRERILVRLKQHRALEGQARSFYPAPAQAKAPSPTADAP